MFRYTTAIDKIRGLTQRKKVIQGGTSAGKTYAIIPILIDEAAKTPNLKITIVAETIPAVKDGAVDIFKSVMMDTNRWIETHWIGNPMEYTFGNKSRIQFKAFDTEGKAKASGKRDILFLNEGNHIPYDIADALMIRSKETYIDYNPNSEFWAHTEVLKEPNSEFLLLTYLDNEALPPETLEDMLIKKAKAYLNVNGDLFDPDNIKNTYWDNWWKVYGMGKVGALQGSIFSDWEDGEFDESIPSTYGMDFGFQDPDTLIKVAIDEKRKRIYIHELMYANNQSTKDLKDRLTELLPNKNVKIVADCAEPRTIIDLLNDGFNVVKSIKGPDSIKNGIKKIQEYKLIITPQSLNVKTELRNYIWNDKKSETPIDAYNHTLDPLRYVVSDAAIEPAEITW